MNARSAAEGLAESKDPSLAPLQAMMINVALPVENFQREKGKPVVFFTGDSTVKNADKEEDGMWGWGSQAYTIFNPKKITCVNAAKAGRSSRSYLNEGRWEKVYNSLQPGDYVLIEFGHNDICSLTDKKMRGSIPCAKDTCNVYQMQERKKVNILVFDNCGFGCINNLEMNHGIGSIATEFRYTDGKKPCGDLIPVDYAKIGEGYGLKTYTCKTIAELEAALEDAKKQEKACLFDLKVIPKTMTDGYESWWNVGIATTSSKESVRKACVGVLEGRREARDY